MSELNTEQGVLSKAVEDGGSYGIIRKRFEAEGSVLKGKIDILNEKRQLEFGGSKSEIIGKINIRTDNKCVPVDMIQFNGNILLGYQVFMGMRAKVKISDVFSIYHVNEEDGDFVAKQGNLELIECFNNPSFLESFDELFTYYSEAKLVKLSTTSNYILATFRIGSSLSDVRVFRWSIGNDGTIVYKDDKGHGDIELPVAHDFEWILTTRDDYVSGAHPHISIMDKVFVETVGGDLTIKIENNSQTGQGIYSEPVDDENQGLEDAKVYYASLGALIVLRIIPYRENVERYFVYNTVTETVQRIDSIGKSCIELPESHGIVFPNGLYLENGNYKVFDEESSNLTYYKTLSSPNGEDYMFVFYDPYEGFYSLYLYNIIQKELSNPIHAHGFSLYNDGKIVIFRESENIEPTKVHPMRIWQTPFVSDEFFSSQEKNIKKNFFTKIGNAELVRGISDLYTVFSFISKKEVSTSIYERLIVSANKILDEYHWMNNNEVGKIEIILKEIIQTSNLVVEEFEKVKSIQNKANEVLSEAVFSQKKIISDAKLANQYEITSNVEVLSNIKFHLGHLISIKDYRYIDLEKVSELEIQIIELKDDVNKSLLNVLQEDKSFDDYFKRIEKIEGSLNDVNKVIEINPLEDDCKSINNDIDVINNEVNEIEVKDSTVVTKILDMVSEVFAKLNQIKSKIKNKKKSFLSTEAKAEFASQFKLLSQSVSSSISKADSPDSCDQEMARLMTQIESLESKFSDFDDYLEDIYTKREEVSSIFESHKQQLLNDIQKRTVNIEKAANITLRSIEKKAEKFGDIDSLNSYFASDSMILKVYGMIKDVKELGDSVRSDDIDSKLRKIKDQSLRSLRDNKDIFEDGGNIMKMGKHKFSVNKNNVDLTIMPIDGVLTSHLTATDYYEKIENDELESLKHVWDLDIVSETKEVYRGEFLAYSVLQSAENGENGFILDDLVNSLKENRLLSVIQKYSATRYKEGYVKGVHDCDAEKILTSILKIYGSAGLLKYSQKARTIAILSDKVLNDHFELKNYVQAKALSDKLNNHKQIKSMYLEFSRVILNIFDGVNGYSVSESEAIESAEYYCEHSLLVKKVGTSKEIEITSDAYSLCDAFTNFKTINLIELSDDFSISNFLDIRDWIDSFAEHSGKKEWKYFVDEATIAFVLNNDKGYKISPKDLKLSSTIENLLGDHPLIENGEMTLVLDNFMSRTRHQGDVVVPDYTRYIELRHEITISERENLQLDSFKASPLSSFVRNKLITDSYLHLIGDNFAKQMGALGSQKRSDLMGMLLLISPPGYGKTTLIEYVASKLGLVFMKINCPSLNHEVVSLDPAEAPDATAAKELEKLNLALEMGNNVLLYLDDIQHTNPEFLQKFISLCDGTRKIDGVWKGKPKTYDMKGKKFAVCMAGNPYTESGEAFKIPDMLANRADIYNLGDMLSGQDGIFELSYIENTLTSNSVLAPLANRDLGDLYKLIDIAKGVDIPLNDMDYNYSPAEANEIVGVLKILIKIQNVVLRVNQQYIISASIEDKYREEPSFRLQGSYRNMNKMTEKVVSIMNEDEVQNLILDHYKGESQTLTVGSEDNYIKLKIMLGCASETELERWSSILLDFSRNKLMGDSGSDGSSKIAVQLETIKEALEGLTIHPNETNTDINIEKALKMMEKLVPSKEKDDEVIKLLGNLNQYLITKRKRNK